MANPNQTVITPIELAKFLSSQGLNQQFDFSNLQALVRMRSASGALSLTYHEFCAWVSPAIEAAPSGFMFRHDQKRNPAFEQKLKEQKEKMEPNQLEARKTMLSEFDRVQKLFINRTFANYKNIQTVYNEWKD